MDHGLDCRASDEYNSPVIETEMLLTAYRRGIFPMAVDKRGRIGWFSPDPRAVIPLDARFHIPHGLRRTLKQKKFEITFDTDFETVMRECGKRREGTWISKGIIDGYCELHRLGHAHSIETRLDGKLVGGLYGVTLGGAFFGESMFHRARDASKVALVHLVARLKAGHYTLLDTQFVTDHLRTFGAVEVTRPAYHKLLDAALVGEGDFGALAVDRPVAGSAALACLTKD